MDDDDNQTTIVEATSLSHVTSIAANPPPHPTTPINIPQLPLVLYIARVPGSRDVFLTPIKPRQKIVTAEDVQSSLYYIHVNCEEDYQEPNKQPSTVSAHVSQLLPLQEDGIRRKPPLPQRPIGPPTPPYPVDDPPPRFQYRQPSPQRKHITRKPVGATDKPSLAQPRLDLPVLPRRPLPSPPVDDQPDRYSLHEDNVRLLRQSDHSHVNNPYTRTYDQPTPQIDPSTAPPPGSLTLIRRDPSSADQWNVAFIHDPPVHEVSSAALLNPSAAKRTKRGGAPLYLDISNTSYLQYTNTDRPESRVSISSTSSAESDPPPEGIFRRRLYMPGSKYSEHSYGHNRKFSSIESYNGSDDISMRRSMRGSVDMSVVSSSAPTSDRRNKGYIFISPWDGRCEFSTGTTGKSLKCRHFLPSHQGGIVAEVSELRFNLPTSQSKTATTLAEKRSSYFHRLHGRSHSSEDGNDTPDFIIRDDGRIDLTLGQEKAGGGFGGKQAKLGKLIIYPEGLKMLDLLVAANLGLWWRAYERG